MSFVTPAAPPRAEAEPKVTNDPWFPDMDPAAVRAACRLESAVTTARLLPALQAAMLLVNEELADYRLRHAEYGSLAGVPAMHVGGESAQVLRYRRAVHACVQAELAEAYRSMDTLPAGMSKDARVLEALTVRVDDYRRDMRWAISDLLGRQRTTVELI